MGGHRFPWNREVPGKNRETEPVQGVSGTAFRAGKKEWAFLYMPQSKMSGRKHLAAKARAMLQDGNPDLPLRCPFAQGNDGTKWYSLHYLKQSGGCAGREDEERSGVCEDRDRRIPLMFRGSSRLAMEPAGNPGRS